MQRKCANHWLPSTKETFLDPFPPSKAWDTSSHCMVIAKQGQLVPEESWITSIDHRWISALIQLKNKTTILAAGLGSRDCFQIPSWPTIVVGFACVVFVDGQLHNAIIGSIGIRYIAKSPTFTNLWCMPSPKKVAEKQNHTFFVPIYSRKFNTVLWSILKTVVN